MIPGAAPINGNLMPLVTATPAEVEAVRVQISNQVGMKPHRKSAHLIAVIQHILEEYTRFGKVTVRQVYYQLVSRGVIKNSEKSHNNYGHHLTTGRKGGVIRWDAFEDRARIFYGEPKPKYDISNEVDPQDALVDWFRYALNPKVASEYGICRWNGQSHYVEVWVEKDALAGFLSPICEELGVGLVVSKGYTSVTFKQEAIARFKAKIEDGKSPVLLYLGDLDPSGYDIFRCIKEEIDVAKVKRIGLNPEDVAQYGLVPNVIKDGDTRTPKFKKQFPGLENNVYELDALPPAELMDRVRRNVLEYFDAGIFQAHQQTLRHWRAAFTDHQDHIKQILEDTGIGLDI